MPQWPWQNRQSNVDEHGRSSLWHHAAEGNLVALENELRSSTDNVSAADKDGFTALHAAAQNGHLHIIRQLLAAGAKVNVIDCYGNGPLWTASRQASLAIAIEPAFEIVALLLKSGANPHHVNNAERSPVVWATRSAKLRETYIAAGVPVPTDRE
jgi:ankyrin repeat protein